MDTAATQELRSLEREHLQAHLRTLLEVLPRFHSSRRQQIRGMIVVLDSLEGGPQRGPYLRSVPHAIWGPDKEKHDQRRRILRLMQEVIDTQEKDGRLEVCPARICEALLTLRHRILEYKISEKVLGILLEETSHAIQGSVFDREVMPELQKKIATGSEERWVFVENYIDRTSFEGETVKPAFQALLSEVAATTCDLPIEEITPERVASISPLVLPFSALGVPRGAAVWFLLGKDEYLEINGEQAGVLGSNSSQTQISKIQGLTDVLSIFYSGAVIDIFTAYFMERLVRWPDKWQKFTDIAEQAFAYLYPSKGLRFLNQDDTRSCDNDMRMELRFDSQDLIDSLGVAGVCWELLYSKRLGSFLSWLDHEKETQLVEKTYHNQIEVALMALPSLVQQRFDVEYGQVMNMFGHHIGTLFKTSGVMQLLEQYENHSEPDHAEIRQVIDNLLPIWGVSRAVSLIKRQKNDNIGSIYRDWIDGSWVANDEVGGEFAEAVLDLIHYVFDFGSDQQPLLDWVVCHPDGREEQWLWQASAVDRTGRLRSLPCFLEEPVLFDKTLAVTMGLLEMVTNVRRYPKADAAGREDRELLEKLRTEEKRVCVRYAVDGGIFKVVLEQPCTVPIERSRSLEQIIGIEKRLFDGLIESNGLKEIGKTSSKWVNRYRQKWTFNWLELKNRYRDFALDNH